MELTQHILSPFRIGDWHLETIKAPKINNLLDFGRSIHAYNFFNLKQNRDKNLRSICCQMPFLLYHSVVLCQFHRSSIYVVF